MSNARNKDCRRCVHSRVLVSPLWPVSQAALLRCGWTPSPGARVPPWAAEAPKEIEPSTARHCLCYERDPKKVIRRG